MPALSMVRLRRSLPRVGLKGKLFMLEIIRLHQRRLITEHSKMGALAHHSLAMLHKAVDLSLKVLLPISGITIHLQWRRCDRHLHQHQKWPNARTPASRGSQCTSATSDHHPVKRIGKKERHSLQGQVGAQNSKGSPCPEEILHHHPKMPTYQNQLQRNWPRERELNSKAKQCQDVISCHHLLKRTKNSSKHPRARRLQREHLSRARRVQNVTLFLHPRKLT
mmetsp:Transcript_85968/g.135740  ORF Transcript_85968/g.135740 Transcript_85968/m.135740 type:complete len:222 (-) Transcript_85968:441-1106(-)